MEIILRNFTHYAAFITKKLLLLQKKQDLSETAPRLQKISSLNWKIFDSMHLRIHRTESNQSFLSRLVNPSSYSRMLCPGQSSTHLCLKVALSSNKELTSWLDIFLLQQQKEARWSTQMQRPNQQSSNLASLSTGSSPYFISTGKLTLLATPPTPKQHMKHINKGQINK